MINSTTIQTTTAGFVVAVVGFFSSFPIVLQGVRNMGADEGQAASSLLAASVAMGLAAIVLSLWKRMPISVAWSTPGVALLAVIPAPEAGFSGAIAAFLTAGLLTVVAGLWKPLARLAASVPAPLAQAMLSGVLIWICITPITALADQPETALPVILTWFVVGRFSRLFAVPAAVVAALIVTGFTLSFSFPAPDTPLAVPVFILPEFSWAAVISIGVPLFIVTMATQNIPGIAVMKAHGYAPPPGPLFSAVGGASLLSAPFGAPATCIAAITAAMCANEDSHPDPKERYRTAVAAGVFYILFGLLSAVIITIALATPPMLLGTLAGVALLPVFANSATAALSEPDTREAATVTFLTTASGVTIFGLGAAVWGLVFGGVVIAATRYIKPHR